MRRRVDGAVDDSPTLASKGDRAFMIKLRPTEERPLTLMLPKPLRGINDTYHVVASGYLMW